MLDLSAAFDTIDHQILIERLSTTFGFRGTVCDWFKSYLSDRSQSVIIENTTSDPRQLCFGVPQGSVLGPILYTLYTSPLGSIIRNHNINFHMYADDTQMRLSLEPSEMSTTCAVPNYEKCISDVKSWMLCNKVKLNDEKTEILFCNPKNLNASLDHLKIGNEIVYVSNSAKNLGVYLDCNCPWTAISHMFVNKCIFKYLYLSKCQNI